MNTRFSSKAGLLLLVTGLLAACGEHEQGEQPEEGAAFASSYEAPLSQPVLLTNATILDGEGGLLENASLLLQDGKIAGIGQDLGEPEEGTRVIDAKGKWITPGIIDAHSHLGVYPAPGVATSADGNEMTKPVTADVWAEHSVWPQDPQFALALAAGVTSMQILPGSANLIGGRSVTLKNKYGRSVMDMKFPGAPYGLKMACGENPKRVYGEKGGPMTRMGNVAGYRAAWIEAAAYKKSWDDYQASLDEELGGEPPTRDLRLETLAGVLSGNILVHNHCYRADEMAVMLEVAKEFGYKITAFHHAVEAYKIADLLAENDVCAALWADWWGFKQEAYDSVRENVAMVDAAGACAIVHSDSAVGIQHLNQEAAKSMAAGRKAGMGVGPERAIQWITLNPAKALGIAEQTGSLVTGKMADVAVWNGNPFSVYSKVDRVYIDGALAYDRSNPARQPHSDFDLGILDPEGERP